MERKKPDLVKEKELVVGARTETTEIAVGYALEAAKKLLKTGLTLNKLKKN